MSLTTIDFSQLDLRQGERLLDLGCGEGRHAITAYLEGEVQVVGVDLSLQDLGTASARFAEFENPDLVNRSLGFINGSGLRLPFADASFDKVICAEVLEHVPDYNGMLSEIRRVLKPGGLLAVSVPRWFPEWLCWQFSDAYHEVEGGHVRIFKAGWLKECIQRKGLHCFNRHFAHGLHSPYWWLRCLFWDRGEDTWPVRMYHKMLVWDLMNKPRITRVLERLLNPLIGKSLVMYFVRSNA
ncbi:MAG: class I SAM-dependent methyltransferase [Pseudomonadales bacterium]|jgi:ubiquinone/menaquinone biosynthesis C-methylase UbiE|nr:class I SAM-dependent methyltransferase [Pseudomonadales bacterium]MDP6470943.1 class I SAM-dependent methyltransferase [Pseudomonadales bacterium]MDP6825872.1 class I SAM-dependent methyltransferase [Pseudomonadales bacterium]MDP6972840.1 class I SAM-dependent methyltransferase [Pseudomonadales bacterium]|tara:strand:+ start:1659 stop:2378 length:720 start_codon:yes stop_codon:yes gene_type:complete